MTQVRGKPAQKELILPWNAESASGTADDGYRM